MGRDKPPARFLGDKVKLGAVVQFSTLITELAVSTRLRQDVVGDRDKFLQQTGRSADEERAASTAGKDAGAAAPTKRRQNDDGTTTSSAQLLGAAITILAIALALVVLLTVQQATQ